MWLHCHTVNISPLNKLCEVLSHHQGHLENCDRYLGWLSQCSFAPSCLLPAGATLGYRKVTCHRGTDTIPSLMLSKLIAD